MMNIPTLLVVAGVAVALQWQVIGSMNRTLGTATTMLVTYGSGGVISALWPDLAFRFQNEVQSSDPSCSRTSRCFAAHWQPFILALGTRQS